MKTERLAYTMRETAAMLGVNYQTVWRLNKRGLLRSSTALRTKLFPRAEIERFLKETIEPAPAAGALPAMPQTDSSQRPEQPINQITQASLSP